MLFGSSKILIDHFDNGMPYADIRKVYSVNIVYFDLGSGKVCEEGMEKMLSLLESGVSLSEAKRQLGLEASQ